MSVRAKKRFGQHFLRDEGTARRIVDALAPLPGGRYVIEVGPGTGALTRHLLERPDIQLICVEVDHEAADHLDHTFPQLGARLIVGDMLTMDLGALLDRVGAPPHAPFTVIGNFPYNISTEIVFRILAHRQRCHEVVGMFQKEVADRLRAAPGSRTYGITSVLTQAWYDVQLLFNLGPGAFSPPPKVDSSVVRFVRNTVQQLPCDEELFRLVVRTAFNQRRKTLNNALKPVAALNHRLPTGLAGCRAEQLSVADFVELARLAGERPA
jgi:16S rRNA (adenine1518-N6/adenine1519-N6)-dimethyltransferase